MHEKSIEANENNNYNKEEQLTYNSEDAENSSSSGLSSTSSSEERDLRSFTKKEYYNFEPLYLDNSNLRQGQHSTVV